MHFVPWPLCLETAARRKMFLEDLKDLKDYVL